MEFVVWGIGMRKEWLFRMRVVVLGLIGWWYGFRMNGYMGGIRFENGLEGLGIRLLKF